MKQWYESLFENYGKKYDHETFSQGTIGECDFIEKEINFNKSQKIIDVGCGTGRHSIELTKRGYQVTGIDLMDYFHCFIHWKNFTHQQRKKRMRPVEVILLI
jgi:2-polyprenyl-3-methyl-5-hydroxy-6-metoxy-1,4-benzoquinol methylase